MLPQHLCITKLHFGFSGLVLGMPKVFYCIYTLNTNVCYALNANQHNCAALWNRNIAMNIVYNFAIVNYHNGYTFVMSFSHICLYPLLIKATCYWLCLFHSLDEIDFDQFHTESINNQSINPTLSLMAARNERVVKSFIYVPLCCKWYFITWADMGVIERGGDSQFR